MTNKALDESLEDKIKEADIQDSGKSIPNIRNSDKKKFMRKVFEDIIDAYDWAYTNYRIPTNYLSTAIGTIGGDMMTKQFTDNPHISLRDIEFTGAASVVYSLLANKMMEWSTKLTDKLGEHPKYRQRIKESKFGHDTHNAMILTLMYVPINMVYWNVLSVKNNMPITLENNLLGLAACSITSIPYLYAEYIAITKLNKPETRKYLRPFYSVVELLWNTAITGGRYVAKKI